MIDNKSTTKVKENKYPPIILRRNRKRELRNFLEKFADLIGLLPYGTSNLLEQARGYLQAASILMLMIFTFDFLAWGVLFNLIFHQGKFEVSNLAFIAAFLAFLLATSILIFEITIFTADFSRFKQDLKVLKPWIAIKSNKSLVFSLVVRIFIVIASALITAQPLHILVFDGPISRRAQEEQAIQRASLIVRNSIKQDNTLSKIFKAIAMVKTKPKSNTENKIELTEEQINELNESIKNAQSYNEYIIPFMEKEHRIRKNAEDCESGECMQKKIEIATLNDKLKEKDKLIAKEELEKIEKNKQRMEIQKKILDLNLMMQDLKHDFDRLNKKKKSATSEDEIESINKDLKQKKNEINDVNKKLKKEIEDEDGLKIAIEAHEKSIERIEKEDNVTRNNKRELESQLILEFNKYEQNELNKIGGETTEEREENAQIIIDIYLQFISALRSKKLKMGETFNYDINENNENQVDQILAKRHITDSSRIARIRKNIDEEFLKFTFQSLDFFERLRIWEDLRDGNPSKCPDELSDQEITYIKENYKIPVIRLENQNKRFNISQERKQIQTKDEKKIDDLERLKSEGLSYSLYHIAVTFIGMFIPLMVLIFKIFLPDSLAKYYSNDYQTYCGHPEAIFFSNYIYEDEINDANVSKSHQNQDQLDPSNSNQTHLKEDI